MRASRGWQQHFNGNGSMVFFQTQTAPQVRAVVAGEREETDEGARIRVSTEMPGSRHIQMSLTGEILLTVVREDDLDTPGRVPPYLGGRVQRDLLPVVITLLDTGTFEPSTRTNRFSAPRHGPQRNRSTH